LEKEIKDKPYFFLNLEDKEIVNLLSLSPKNIFQVLPFDLKKKNFIFAGKIFCERITPPMGEW
jgi:hypothetical protein